MYLLACPAVNLRRDHTPIEPDVRTPRATGLRDVPGAMTPAAPGDERRHAHPLGHRAGRPEGRRGSSSRWSTTSCASWPPSGWPGRSPARPSRPRRWSTRRTSGWSDAGEAPGAGTAAATSSPPPPRRCAASSSTAPDRKRLQAGRRPPAGRARPGVAPDGRRPRPTTCSPSTRRSTGSPAIDPQAAELVKLRLLRRADGRAGRRGPGHLPPHRRARTGPSPAPGSSASSARATSRPEPANENPRRSWRAPALRRRTDGVGADSLPEAHDGPRRTSSRRSSARPSRSRHDGPERAAFLDEACGGDAGLRAQVETLLDAHERAGSFLGTATGRSAAGTGRDSRRRLARPDRRRLAGREGPGAVDRPVQAAAADRRGGHGHRLHGRAGRSPSAARSP